ncbi:hypothetical protein J1614_011919 [Plenodomus biglobosus]|nr:hypothetical protein J1614_011919 [Plenodomus biglobosus]
MVSSTAELLGRTCEEATKPWCRPCAWWLTLLYFIRSHILNCRLDKLGTISINMKASQFLLFGFCTAATATAVSSEDTLFASLLKRQEPGTPAYNCHDNCGAAITQSKQPSPCTSSAFRANYANCLQCSGPDNYNIWRYYGRTLAAAGKTCDLETEPKSGEQAEVGPAVQEGAGGASASASASASAGETVSSSVLGATSETVAPPAVSSGMQSETAAPLSTSAATPAAPLSSASIMPSRTSNVTASTAAPTPAEVSTNAGASLGLGLNDAGIVGAVFVGALFGL